MHKNFLEYMGHGRRKSPWGYAVKVPLSQLSRQDREKIERDKRKAADEYRKRQTSEYKKRARHAREKKAREKMDYHVKERQKRAKKKSLSARFREKQALPFHSLESPSGTYSQMH